MTGDLKNWTFIGGGAMASAIVSGLLSSKFLTPDHLWVSGRNPQNQAKFADMGVNAQFDNVAAAGWADVLVLAVKPHGIRPLLAELDAAGVLAGKLVVSIAAGLTCAQLQSAAPSTSLAVVRVMPNTAVSVGAGAVVLSGGEFANGKQVELIRLAFSKLGCALVIPEHLIDAATGISGSGIAYLFVIMEAMADGGVLSGLPRATAQTLAAATVSGAAAMVAKSGEHPGALKDSVCSAGGATIAALHEMEKSGVRATMMTAVQTVAKRCEEMSRAAED